MAELIRGLDPSRVAGNLAEVRREVDAACRRVDRPPTDVEILAAVKYVPAEELAVLRDAGLSLLGENRAQALTEKVTAASEAGLDGFTWDFIGHLQSRKVKTILPQVRLIHSVGSDSVLRELDKHAGPQVEVLVEVNVAEEAGKSGIVPEELDAFIARCPVRVTGLMTMPPLTADPEESRPWFALLADLAAERGLPRLSMGTTQDFPVAVEEGATIVRIGAFLYGELQGNAP